MAWQLGCRTVCIYLFILHEQLSYKTKEKGIWHIQYPGDGKTASDTCDRMGDRICHAVQPCGRTGAGHGIG